MRLIKNYVCLAKAIIVFHFLTCLVVLAQDKPPISSLEVKYRKQILQTERFSVFLLQIPPGHASLMHKHDTDMLSIFVSGGETKSTIYGRPPSDDKFSVGEV